MLSSGFSVKATGDKATTDSFLLKCKIFGIFFITFSYVYVLSDKQIGMSPWHFTET